jgi:aminomethyltransferase
MKRTALFDKHVSLGAKIVPFAGFEMPVQYSGVTEEHFAVREKAGMFDVSTWDNFLLKDRK